MTDLQVRDLEALAMLFKAGGWRELSVEGSGFSIFFSMDPLTESIGIGRDPVGEPIVPPVSSTTPGPVAPTLPTHPINQDWQTIVAPNLGTFYRSPKPGSPPFVEIGDRVGPGSEVCLLEVMKLFTSVSAGVTGTVRKVTATDAELVESGQVLFYIDAD